MLTRSTLTLIGSSLLFVLPLAACRSAYTYVLEGPNETAMARIENAPRLITLVPAEHVSEVNPDLDQHFRAEFARIIADRNAKSADPIEITPSNEPESAASVRLTYRVLLVEPGSSGVRVGAFLVSLVGAPVNSLGEGNVGVEASFTTPDGTPIARILADGPIDGPLADRRSGLTSAAKSIAAFTSQRIFAPAIRAGITSGKTETRMDVDSAPVGLSRY